MAPLNKLADSLSPYLLQHATNPVEWYPWGDEALQLARRTDRPIFLSIGYSSCHWCHVMAHESFENETIAAQMNRDFVNIKVDREERPDLDEIYMAATQLFSGSGGWPMTVFLNHDLTPFFAGTYFPPEPRFNRLSFPMLLERISSLWKNNRGEVQEQGDTLKATILRLSELSPAKSLLSTRLLEETVERYEKRYDKEFGGFSDPPKFPDPQGLLLLCNALYYQPRPELLAMVEHTLTAMALGGIYDHLGGGFSRYSVDEEWLAPHFEKMLYDNAMLPRAYITAWQKTKKPFYKAVALEVLHYVAREMRDPAGGFYSAQDADSEGEEGKFYVWSASEIQSVLGEGVGDLTKEFCKLYDVHAQGNWEGKNILRLSKPLQEWEKEKPGIQERMKHAREKLFKARAQRIPPGLDDKILTEWNGMMITTFAQVGAIVQDPALIEIALKAAHFLEKHLRNPQNRLLRVYRQGKSHTLAYQADYAAYAEACLALYTATFDLAWIHKAEQLVAEMNTLFWDTQDFGYFYSTASAEDLIVRTKHPHDNPYPSGNTMALSALQKLYRLTEKKEYLEKIQKIFQTFHGSFESQSFGFTGMLGQLQDYLYPKVDITLVGPWKKEKQNRLMSHIQEYFVPGKSISATEENASPLSPTLPCFQGRSALHGKVTAYVCIDQVCSLPLHDPQELETLLQKQAQQGLEQKASKHFQFTLTPQALLQLRQLWETLEPSTLFHLHLTPQNQVELQAQKAPEKDKTPHYQGIPIVIDPQILLPSFILDYQNHQFCLKKES
jgi:uncharacterized protein YyaL (SSP411 family)